jgi:mRNA-degrading endonuclease RelE of RelBE toxin-antitoxin system
MFNVLLDIPAYTFLADAGETMRSRVKETLEELAHDPVPREAKRIIESKEKIFRLRSRHLRLLYRVNYENLTLVIITIEPLARMYR